MQTAIDRFTDRTLNEVSTLRYDIEAYWAETLKAEGFVWIGKDSRGNIELDVSAEIESLLGYEKAMSFYNSTDYDLKNRERFLLDYAGRFFTKNSLRKKVLPRYSFVKRAVNNLAMVYKWGAERTLENEGSQKILNGLFKQCKINTRSKQWNRILTLCDVSAVMPVVKTKKRGRKSVKTLDLVVLSPNQFRALYDSEGNLTKFMYASWRSDSDGTQRERVIVVWTATEVYYRDVDGKIIPIEGNEEMTNPYNEIPAVVFTSNPSDPFSSGGRTSLIEANLHRNFLKLLESVDSAYAAAGVWFMRNLGLEAGVEIGPDQVVQVENVREDEQESIIEYKTAESFTEVLRVAGEKEEKYGLLNEGLSPALLAAEVSEMSGIALKNLSRETLEQREDDIEVMEECEMDLYHAIKIVAEYHNLGQLPDESTYTVKFSEPSFGDDPVAERDEMEWKIKNSLVSPLEVCQYYGIEAGTQEEAVKVLQENKSAWQKVRGGLGNLFSGTGATGEQTTQNQTALLQGTQS